jgi:anti-sigma regulatory factor (Ser/Thr protein kinase)
MRGDEKMADKDQDEFDDKLHKTEINIDKPTDILKVEKVFEKLQQRYNMCEKKIHETAIIAGELGENIIKHGKHGKMTILYHEHKTMTSFIEIISENVGVLPSRAQEKGMTTKHNSLGIGLNVISRFSDILTYEQEGDILRIRSFKYCWDFPARSEVAVLSYPTSMCIQSNGDSYFIHKSESELLCVIDALGHGTEAYKSASAVINFLQDIASGWIITLTQFYSAGWATLRQKYFCPKETRFYTPSLRKGSSAISIVRQTYRNSR